MGSQLSAQFSAASSSYSSAYQQQQMSAGKIVESAIADNAVTIFSKTYCPYCRRAKGLFQSEFPDVQVKVYELDQRQDGTTIQNYLWDKTGQETVPNIFINQKHVGGCDDVVSLNRRGILTKLVHS